MVIILFVLIGIFVMFPKSISISNSLELRRPKTIIFGGIILACSFISQVITDLIDTSRGYSVSWFLAYSIPLIAAIVSVFFLKTKKSNDPYVQNVKNRADKIVNVVTWAIVGLIGIGVLFVAYNVLTTK